MKSRLVTVYGDLMNRLKLIGFCCVFLSACLVSLLLVAFIVPSMTEEIVLFCPPDELNTIYNDDRCKTIPVHDGSRWSGWVKGLSWRNEFLTLAVFPKRFENMTDISESSFSSILLINNPINKKHHCLLKIQAAEQNSYTRPTSGRPASRASCSSRSPRCRTTE